MEPSLIRKYLIYVRKKEKGNIKPSPRVNDSGVALTDMQSNDCWSISFLLLLTHDPRFAFCYTYKADHEDNCPIRFNNEIFVKLFKKVLRKFEADRNFCYVLSRLCGFYRFMEKMQLPPNASSEEQNSLEPVEYNKRDLKFFVWLLTYAKFPEKKVIQYEDGKSLREIDECGTLASNASLYESAEKESPMESQVKQYMTDTEILRTLDRNDQIIENKFNNTNEESDPPMPETGGYRATLFEEPTYSFFEQKSHLQEHAKSRKLKPKKYPKQNFKALPQYLYSKQGEPKEESKKNLLYKYDDEESWHEAPNDSYFSIDNVTSTNAMTDLKISKIRDKLTTVPAKWEVFEAPPNSVDQALRPLPEPPSFSRFGEKQKPKLQQIISEENILKAPEKIVTEEMQFLDPISRRRTTKKRNKRRPSRNFDEAVINSLRRVSQRQMVVTNLDEISGENEVLIEKRAPFHGSEDTRKNNCQCRLCTKASSRIKRKPTTKRPPLANFDTKKSAEELKKDRLESRIKRVSRVKYQAPTYADPYYNHPKLGFERRANQAQSVEKADNLGRLSRNETSYYKTSKIRRLQFELRRENKSQGGLIRYLQETRNVEFAEVLQQAN